MMRIKVKKVQTDRGNEKKVTSDKPAGGAQCAPPLGLIGLKGFLHSKFYYLMVIEVKK